MTGRRFTARRLVRLGDVRVDGTLRLDALARYAQDIATDDAADSGLTHETGFWILRRTVVELVEAVHLGQRLEITTFCGGSGPRWAERRTVLTGSDGLLVEQAAVWVHVDRARGVPAPVPPRFFEIYGEGARRKVRARLEHPAPEPDAGRRSWPLRASDFDVLRHVNNAVYWAAVEDELAQRPPARVTHAEMEYRAGIDPGDRVELETAGEDPVRIWFIVGGEVRASAAFSTVAAPAGP